MKYVYDSLKIYKTYVIGCINAFKMCINLSSSSNRSCSVFCQTEGEVEVENSNMSFLL